MRIGKIFQLEKDEYSKGTLLQRRSFFNSKKYTFLNQMRLIKSEKNS